MVKGYRLESSAPAVQVKRSENNDLVSLSQTDNEI
jgi:hypothetical protein